MKNLIIVLNLFLLISCETSTKETVVPKRRVSDLYQFFGDSKTLIRLPVNSDTTLSFDNGTLIEISDSTFGSNSDSITLEIIQSYNLSDIYFEELSTMDNSGTPLSSNGMFKISTIEKGVSINPNYPIIYSLPTIEYDPEMTLFEGNVNVNGDLVWSQNGEIQKFLNTVPLTSLDFSYYIFNSENDYINLSARKSLPSNDLQGDSTSFECGISSYFIELLKSDSLKNTFISTKEFELRMAYIHRSCDPMVLEIYLKNLDRNLFEADYLAHKYLNSIDNPMSINFKKFAEEGLTTVRNSYNNNYAIRAFKNARDRVKELRTKAYNTYKISINSFGWYNIDKYLKDPRLNFSDQVVKIKDFQQYTQLNIALIIEPDVVCIFLKPEDDNKFSLRNAKLPIGEKARYLITAIKDTTTYFTSKEIILKKVNNIEFDLTETSSDQIKKNIESIFKLEENEVFKQRDNCCLGG
jgi:hypothetical protein